MFCFNRCLLIHNSTHHDCSYQMRAWGFDWRLSVWFSMRSRATLQKDDQLPIPLMGWLNSHNFGWGINTGKCLRERTDLSDRFDWKMFIFFNFFFCSIPFLHRTPCEINARQSNIWRQCTESLAHWIVARHEGDGNFLFCFIYCFSSPCRRWNIKGELLLIQAINYSHNVWIEFISFSL